MCCNDPKHVSFSTIFLKLLLHLQFISFFFFEPKIKLTDQRTERQNYSLHFRCMTMIFIFKFILIARASVLALSE